MKFTIVGYVKSKFASPDDPKKMRQHTSEIVVESEFSGGLYRIEENSHLQVVFYLHKSRDYKLRGKRRSGEIKGVFASRSPNRPSPIGITTVELKERRDNILLVYGLDAIDHTPVLDIKPFAANMDLPKYENNGGE